MRIIGRGRGVGIASFWRRGIGVATMGVDGGGRVGRYGRLLGEGRGVSHIGRSIVGGGR